jgi:hypothetical protein
MKNAIFLSKRMGKKFGVFGSRHCWFLQTLNHNFSFYEKRQFFVQKLAKIA